MKESNLTEGRALMRFILEKAKENKVDAIVFAGDQFHSHALVHLKVMTFWQKTVDWMSSEFKGKIVFITGNHDMIGDAETEGVISAMNCIAVTDSVLIVNQMWVVDDVAFMGYTADEGLFIEQATHLKNAGCKHLFCHQTFSGSKFDNGMYAPDGFDPDKVPFDKIISGHIHSKQWFGKTYYPGTARWDTASDANQEKGIWIFDLAAGTDLMIPTDKVCTPIYKFKITPENETIPEVNGTVFVEMEGPSSWIAKASKKFKGKYRVVPRPTDSILKMAKQETTKDISKYIDTLNLDDGLKKEVVSYIGAL